MDSLYVIFFVITGATLTSAIKDGNVVNVTLGSAQEVVFEPNTVTPLDIYPDEDEKPNVTTNYAFYSVEVHTHGFPVNLESSKTPKNMSKPRLDGGLLVHYVENVTMRVYVTNNRSTKVYGVCLGRGVGAKNPIPGMGPHSNSTNEIRPNVQVSWNDFTTRIKFKEAGSLSSEGFQLGGGSGKVFNYEVYQYWFPEADYHVDDYASGLSSMLFASDIRANGFPVEKYYLERDLDKGSVEASFPSFPNTLQLFAVIVTSEDGGQIINEAVYTSGITSGCVMEAKINKDKTRLPSWKCKYVYYTESKIIVAFILTFGVFLAILGHQWFNTSHCVFGTFLIGIAVWPLISGLFYLGHLGSTLIAAGLGIFGAAASLALLNWRRFVLFSTAVANLLTGLLLGALVVHIASRLQSRAMMSDPIYFGTLSAVGGVYFVCTIGFPKYAHLLSCSMVGSFALAAGLDHYLFSTIKFVILNFLRRCSSRKYRNVCSQLPFQDNEKIVVSVWVVVAVISFLLQFWRYRHRAIGQPPLDNVIAVEVTPVNMSEDERTPLLASQPQPGDQGDRNTLAASPSDVAGASGSQRHEVVGYIEGYGAVTAPPPPFLRVYRDPHFYADRDITTSPSRQPRKPRTIISVLQRSSQGSSSEQQPPRTVVRDIFKPPNMDNSPS